jgi:hypothetical protein
LKILVGPLVGQNKGKKEAVEKNFLNSLILCSKLLNKVFYALFCELTFTLVLLIPV